MSGPYLARASELLAGTDTSLIADNAEAIPLADAQFDAVTSVFLFHELPADARRRVMREAWRVLAPGGRFVVCDSAQLADSRELEAVLHAFAATYHEPYYKGYLRDDLAGVMTECGFEVESSTPHLVSKVVVGRKPPRDAGPCAARRGGESHEDHPGSAMAVALARGPARHHMRRRRSSRPIQRSHSPRLVGTAVLINIVYVPIAPRAHRRRRRPRRVRPASSPSATWPPPSRSGA